MSPTSKVLQVTGALILSYGVWGIVGLNALVRALRQRFLFHMYMTCFLFFLMLSFWLYLKFRRERSNEFMLLLGYGLVAGYVASALAILFWPLLGPYGWHKFCVMNWSIGSVLFDGLVMAGWLDGLIAGGMLWLLNWGNNRHKLLTTMALMAIMIVRLAISPMGLLRDIWPAL